MRSLRWIKLGLGALAASFVATQLLCIYTESINWDELALFHRAESTLREGRLFAGGRPGLGTLLTLPLARDCVDAIAVIHEARLWTAAVTFAFLAGLYVWLRDVMSAHRRDAWLDAWFGVALLVCVPVFLRWSLHVRTDQWALACSIWAGVALLRSERKPAWALAAGMLYACGYLFTQKAVYVVALTGLVAVGRALQTTSFDARRWLTRAAWVVAGSGPLLFTYYAGVDSAFEAVRTTTQDVRGGLRYFNHYREVLGHRVYAAMLPSLAPHLALGTLLAVCTARWRTLGAGRELALAWAVLLLGAGVGWFHSSAFPYFWMTLGMFPATAGALALEPIRRLFDSTRLRVLCFGALWTALVLPSAFARALLLEDTQRIQRDALAFVRDNFPASAYGFHVEGGLFCRKDPEPFATYFSANIAIHLSDSASQAAFVDRFRRKPVVFMVDSFRIADFPPAIRKFWDEHYVVYGPRVLIPGVYLPATETSRVVADVIVPGAYQLITEPPGARVRIGNTTLRHGERIELPIGTHVIEAVDRFDFGVVAYAVPGAPDLRREPFYSDASLAEFEGR